MRKPLVITGVDIGSSKICAVSGEIGGAGQVEILGINTVPSRGVARGNIVDLDLCVDSVAKALDGLAARTSRKIENIYVNISGHTIKAERASGMVSLSMRGREITQGDMRRCVNVASTMHLPFESEIIHKVVHSYAIDDQGQIKNPLGLYGSRLSAKIYVVTASVNHIENIRKVINNCGYELKDVVFTGMADWSSLFDRHDPERHMVLIDVGSSLTEAAIFLDGILTHINISAFGVSDIAGPIGTDEGMNGVISRLKEELKGFQESGITFKSAVVVGGGSLIDGMLEMIESRLGVEIVQGVVKSITGKASPIDGVIATTAIGLVRFAAKNHEDRMRTPPKGLINNISTRVIDIFNNYF